MRKERLVTEKKIRNYLRNLREQEKSLATIQKYQRDLNTFYRDLNGQALSKEWLIEWKEHLTAVYAPATVNSMLAAVNGVLRFMGWNDFKVRFLKMQRVLFIDETRELTKEEYIRLVRTADRNGNHRLSLVLQTICSTGIRVSELKFITVEAVRCGRAEVNNKGKRRLVFLPGKLCQLLRCYLKEQHKTTGAVFTTQTGKALDRSNIWREMKALCKSARVDSQKVFPHNLRHLFARLFYSLEHDISRLADILGHSNISTTRIYTAESGSIHVQQLERLELIVT